MSKRARIRAEEKIRIARECIAGKISQAEAEALTGTFEGRVMGLEP